MEIGISSASYFNKLQIEDAVLDIGAHGVKSCELFLNTYSEYEAEFIELLAERINLAGLRVFSVHPMSMEFEPQLFSIHSRQRKDAWKLYEQVLADGKRLGATHYVMHGFANMSGAVKNAGLERIGPIFLDLAALARNYNIQLTLENVSWCVFHQPEFGIRLLDQIGTDTLKFTLDVKQALRSGYSPLDYIKAVGSEIANLHLCDAEVIDRCNHTLKMPGFGTIDFAAVRDALHASDYSGPAFIEVYSDMYQDTSMLYESLTRMRKVFG
ncbi:MAG: sugar phosphate isomerase/epimerase [Clostridia bacterium]